MTVIAEVITYRSFINVASIGVIFATMTWASHGNSYGRKSVPPTNRCSRRFGTPHLHLHVRILVELPNHD